MTRHQRFCSLILFLVCGCQERNIKEIRIWSQPLEVAKSSDSLSTDFSLYEWNGSLLALGGDSGTFAARLLEEDGKSWKTVSTNDPGWIPMDVDPKDNRFVISRATLYTNRLNAEFIIGSLSTDGHFISKDPVPLQLGQAALFPNASPNFEITPGRVLFAGGTVRDMEIRVPYRIAGSLVERNGRQIGHRGDLSANGVFASSDAGRTWRSEPITGPYAEAPIICRTRAFYYFFSKGGLGGIEPYELWYSRCPVEKALWNSPETINRSVARKLSESIHAVGENDTVHLCWLDARNEETRPSLTNPRDGNYEIAYSHRKDSDSNWSNDVILSKGLHWAYAPSMSIEGKNVVVAWSGAKSDKKGRTEWNASDIYYIVSKDGGNTWTKPMQVTDSFRYGITSGRPQVALLNGVIHLFYIQGKINYHEVSTGMVKLNQPPWPIYYTQRPFPK